MTEEAKSDLTWYLLCGVAAGAIAVIAGRILLASRQDQDDEVEQRVIDEALEESFPASDPPAYSSAEHWT